MNDSNTKALGEGAEDKLITIALAKAEGNREKAATILRMPVRTLQRKIAERINNEKIPCKKHKKFDVDLCSGCMYEALTHIQNVLVAAVAQPTEIAIGWEKLLASFVKRILKGNENENRS